MLLNSKEPSVKDAPPFVGLSIPLRLIPDYRDWLMEGPRDLELQDTFLPETLDGDIHALARQARDYLAGYSGRIGVHGPFLGFTFEAGCDPLLTAAVAKRLRQALEFAQAVGATHMVIHSPFPAFGANPFTADSPASLVRALIDQTHAVVDDLLPFAESSGCALVIENIQDTNPSPLLELVRSFQTDSVRMSLDVGHAYIMSQRGGPTPDQWVREAGPLLGHLHLHDTDGATDRHWAPGDGSVNWFALFEALGGLGHSPRLLLEIHDPERIRGGADYLVGRGFAR
jgi:sugar phosphate isomerase/epimerase